jgi:hypothetical protein
MENMSKVKSKNGSQFQTFGTPLNNNNNNSKLIANNNSNNINFSGRIE